MTALHPEVGPANRHRHILAIDADAGLRDTLATLVAAAPAWKLDMTTAAEAAAKGAEVLIVQLDLQRSGAMEDFEQRVRQAPDSRIIAAIAETASAEQVRRLFRAGAADVITRPFAPDALRGALVDMLQQSSPQPRSGQVISVIKGCGGAGATTVALNLAALSASGDPKRSRPARSTALLDLDLQFGDSDVALDLQPRTSILDLLRAEGRVDQQFFESVLTPHGSGVHLLAPTVSVLPLDALEARTACGVIDHARASFSRTFVDLPAGWSEWTFPVLARSDAIIVVTRGTVAGALGARRVLTALKEAAIDRPILLVLNRIAGFLESIERPASVAGALKAAIDGSLPADALVERAADRGQLVTAAFPKAPAARSLRALAAQLDARLAADNGTSMEKVA